LHWSIETQTCRQNTMRLRGCQRLLTTDCNGSSTVPRGIPNA
jgi:hypothetical protein